MQLNKLLDPKSQSYTDLAPLHSSLSGLDLCHTIIAMSYSALAAVIVYQASPPKNRNFYFLTFWRLEAGSPRSKSQHGQVLVRAQFLAYSQPFIEVCSHRERSTLVFLPLPTRALISKPGFSNMWTMNFQMFKLVLEKAEEPEVKFPTSAGSLKKQESSRKASISALLTMPKPLTMWITIKCGKF